MSRRARRGARPKRCTGKTKAGKRCKRRATKGNRCPQHPLKAAGNGDRVKRPQNRDKAVSAAYLRLIGASQEQAADGAGCAERALRDWETCSWWPEVIAEARQRWLRKGDALAANAMLKALVDPREYAQHARWWAERRIPELRPPKLLTEVTHMTHEQALAELDEDDSE